MAIADDARSAGDAVDGADDVEAVPNARLRGALELAVAVAAEAERRGLPFPAGLSALLGTDRLPAAALGRARRAVVGDEGFRGHLAAIAAAAGVDELGTTWLARSEGWRQQLVLLDRLADERERREQAESEARKERKRREAAESKCLRLESTAGQRTDATARLQRERDEARAAAAAAEQALASARDELAAARTAARHAADRQQAADARRQEAEAATDALEARARAAEAQRDEVLSTRFQTPVGAEGVGELRRLAARLRQVSDGLSEIVREPVAQRVPIALPGAVARDRRESTLHLLRAGAAVVVDGYNVAMLGWPDVALAEQRRSLLGLVDNIARRYATQVSVVFDGAAVVGASSEGRRLARVSFSPPGVTADDTIVAHVSSTPSDRPVVVVTDDAELRRRVGRLGANVVRSGDLLDVGLG